MKRAGFTLLELMVVLAVLAITAVAAVPAVRSATSASPELRTATALAGLLAQARSAARESGAPARITIAPATGRYWLTTRDSTSSGTLTLPTTTTLTGRNTERIDCRFEATGSATATAITIHGAENVMVRVDAWSGDITIGDRLVP